MSSAPNSSIASKGGFLEFLVSSHYYAIPIASVREINPIGEITPVPKAAAHVCGVMNLRGQVLPVIDLKVRLYGQVTFKTRNSCIVVISTREGDIGLLVDSVCRVVDFPQNSATTAPDACHLPDKSLVSGIAHDGQKMITILSMDDCIKPIDTDQIRSVHQMRVVGGQDSSGQQNSSGQPSGQPVVATQTPSAAMSLRSAALRLMD